MGNNPSSPLPTSQVNITDFQLVKDIGKGAFGKVRMVRHISRQEDYALKVISKAHCVKSNNARNIIRERTLLEQLDHPLVCNLRFAFQDKHYIYMAMDLMLGGDLRQYLGEHGSVSENLTRFWVAELICAVKYLHSKGIMHRDIKPENILLASDGHLHLTDFNIATHIRGPYDPLLTSPSGTLVYFAPELVKGYGYTEDVDWWCVGITFYECIYGKRPWLENEGKDGILNQILRGPIIYPVQDNVTVSSDCLSALQGLLEKDPMYRLGHAGIGWRRLLQHPFFSGIPWEQVNSRESKFPDDSVKPNTLISHQRQGQQRHQHSHAINAIPKINITSLSTIFSSSLMTALPALSQQASFPATTSSLLAGECEDKNNYHCDSDNSEDKGEEEGWFAAIYDFFSPVYTRTGNEEQHVYKEVVSDKRFAGRLQVLESAFTSFDWTIYDEYQGFMDLQRLSVGSPPPWVKPAFTDADNGRILPMPTISTQRQHQIQPTDTVGGVAMNYDEDVLDTPPVTPTTGSFPHVITPSYDWPEASVAAADIYSFASVHPHYYSDKVEDRDYSSPEKQEQHTPQQYIEPQKKQPRRVGTRYFKERREWERRKSLRAV